MKRIDFFKEESKSCSSSKSSFKESSNEDFESSESWGIGLSLKKCMSESKDDTISSDEIQSEEIDIKGPETFVISNKLQRKETNNSDSLKNRITLRGKKEKLKDLYNSLKREVKVIPL